MKKGTKLLLASGAAALGAHGALKAESEVLFRKAFIADRTLGDRDVIDFLPTEELKDRYIEEADEQIEWFRSSRIEELEMRSFDGLFLNAVYVGNHGKEAPVIILIHGYNADRYCLLKQAYEFDKLGYNLLMPDERGYGKSEGKYVTFGQKESIDILQWIDLLIKRDPEVKIGLYGVSMGGRDPDVRCRLQASGECPFPDRGSRIQRCLRGHHQHPAQETSAGILADAIPGEEGQGCTGLLFEGSLRC